LNSTATSDQPRVTVADITDPSEASAGIETLVLDAVQLQSTPFRARRIVVRLESSTVVYHSTNLRLRTRTHVRADLLAFVTFGPRAQGSVNGLPVRGGLLLAVEPGAEVAFVTGDGWENVTFLVPPRVVEEHLSVRQREGEFRVPHGVATLTADEARARDLFNWGKRLSEAAARQPALFNDVLAEREAAEADMLETLLATLRVASSLEPTRYDRLRQGQSRIVKTAEAHAMEHADGRLRVTDLCRVAAVSERTLECALCAFKDVLGLTPVAYLARLRLHRVHAALLSGSPRSTTVSAEAMKWGFWHFGEFSRAYKTCFGEAPSDTLRRKGRESRAP